MRRFFLIFLAVLLFMSIVGGTITYTLAANAPYLPGESLFTAQLFSERLWGNLTTWGKTDRAALLLNVLIRRIENLEAAQGSANELAALVYFDEAFDQAMLAISQAPDEDQPKLQAVMAALTGRALVLINQLDVMKESSPDTAVLALRTKLNILLQTMENPAGAPAGIAELASTETKLSGKLASADSAVPTLSDNSLDVPISVPFPEGTVEHDIFPLSGGHANLECAACHAGGEYKGTSPTCVNCHAADDTHNGAYDYDCTRCHFIDSWQNVNFDHAIIGATDCVECHSAPDNHYQGACSACHSDTDNFSNAIFNHNTIGGTDCAACHSAPADHYAGSCRACHSDTGNFGNATFNHATIGDTDCGACHSAPANHYAGSCRACHTDTGNFRNATFNHATIGGTDCSACHAPPPNHYGGSCRNCHSDTGNFRNATFNHNAIGGTDCGACHAPPGNHYPGSCRNCHTDTGNFRNVNFSHAGLTDCQSCHSPPSGHYGGQCSDCHSTDSWGGASFNHSFPINHKGANGQCATCHPGGNTSSYTCDNCHEPAKMDKKHKEVGGYPGSCAGCHPNGKD